MIKLLVVDDSPLVRRLLGDLFEAEDDFEVAYARNGVEALDAVASGRPDVITLDVQMPQMDGLTCLDRIMLEHPTPVVIASSVTAPGAEAALKAMDLGAVDVVAKPSGALSLRMDEFGPLLVERVRAAAGARLPSTRRLRDRLRARAGRPILPGREARQPRMLRPSPPYRQDQGVVLMGASTGGPPALDAVLSALPASFPWPIVIAQHMPATFTGALAKRLDTLTPLTVLEVGEPRHLEAGHVYVARGDADILLTRRRQDHLVLSAPPDAARRWHPSVDRLVESTMDVLPAGRILGVLMTGMGNDGATAMTRLNAAGGQTIAQDEASSVVWGMPGELVRAGGAGQVVDVSRIGEALVRAMSA